MTIKALKPRERDTIIQALSAGVVPRIGLQHIQVGRSGEIGALVKDIDRLSDSGSGIRFVIGEYGAGKTFFLNLVRLIALEKKCVTIHADLAPDRRIHATGGQARSLYSEAVRNMATRTKQEGGALQSIIEKFITECIRQAEDTSKPVEKIIDERLSSLQEYVGGYDFAAVLKQYWRASDTGDELLKSATLRWLKGEYTTKTEAKQNLNVRNIIDDSDIYDTLKLLASFVKLAGYSGLLVVFDEMVNLYKLQSSQARNQNYEQILRILNDVLQGNTSHIGFVMGGTPDFLFDTRRGLYSYSALQSRLATNSFATGSLVDLSGPVLQLQSLSVEDLYLLLSNIRSIFAAGDPSKYLVPDEAIPTFMDHCNKRIGEAYFRTPRNTIKAFVNLLSVLEQNPDINWQQLIDGVAISIDSGSEEDTDASQDEDANDLATLRL